MKSIPNLITYSRILAALLLLMTKPLTVYFFILYVFCGISDIVDGYLARKYHVDSNFGATLDSVADMLLTGIVVFLFVPVVDWTFWKIFWITVITTIKFLALIVGLLRFKQLIFLHTYANKVTGLVLFLFPLFFIYFNSTISIAILCSIASISAVEELLINLTTKKIDRNRACIFTK